MMTGKKIKAKTTNEIDLFNDSSRGVIKIIKPDSGITVLLPLAADESPQRLTLPINPFESAPGRKVVL